MIEKTYSPRGLEFQFEDYCEGCEHFTDDTRRMSLTGIEFTFIYCEHRDACARLYKLLGGNHGEEGRS